MPQPIDHFHFWTPAFFNCSNSSEMGLLEKIGLNIGALADNYASFSQHSWNVNATRFKLNEWDFQLNSIEERKTPLWLTALKITSYILSLGTLFILALVIKIIYKKYLNFIISQNDNSSNYSSSSSDSEFSSHHLSGFFSFSSSSSSDEGKDNSSKTFADRTKSDRKSNFSSQLKKPPNIDKDLKWRHPPTYSSFKSKISNEIKIERQIGKTKIVLLYGSITQAPANVLVNAAHPLLVAGAGICGAFSHDAGKTPFLECKEILRHQKRSHIKPGETVLTSAGRLNDKVKAIAHTVGPNYGKKKEKENGKELLTNAYNTPLALMLDPKLYPDFVSSSLQEKEDLDLRSIAYPPISTGIFQAPLEEAISTGVKTVKDFIKQHPDALEEVYFVSLDQDLLSLYQTVIDDEFPQEEETENLVSTTSPSLSKIENSAVD